MLDYTLYQESLSFFNKDAPFFLIFFLALSGLAPKFINPAEKVKVPGEDITAGKGRTFGEACRR
jgi:hypothetical protein